MTNREQVRTLSMEGKTTLLQLARQALQDGVNRQHLQPLEMAALPLELSEKGASFVTLTNAGKLRGCIGALEAYQPLAEDVRQHAVAAALEDYRFLPVTSDELPEIEIEISRLTPPVEMEYDNARDLLDKLRPGVHGVILKDGPRRATFLPQVWEKVPVKEDFLSHLCLKMGATPDAWKWKKLRVWVYEVEEFREKRP